MKNQNCRIMDVFYETEGKEQAFREALNASNKVFCEIKDDNYKRQPNPGRDPARLLEKLLSASRNQSYLVFILRTGFPLTDDMETPYWEVGGGELGKKHDEFLFIYLNRETGAEIAERHNLKIMNELNPDNKDSNKE